MTDPTRGADCSRPWLAIWLLFLFVLCACTAQTATLGRAALVAHAANELLPVALDAYKAEGDKAIADAPDKASAQKARLVVEARWAPFWVAWHDTKAVTDVYLDAKNAPAADQLEVVGCALLAATPRGVERPQLFLGLCDKAGHHVDP